MNIDARLRYRIEVSARELNLIRRALEFLENKDGSRLATELTERANKANADIRKHFEALFEASVKEGNES